MPTDAQLLETGREWPPEAFLDGPVPDGEELLLRTVATVRRRSARSARVRVALWSAAVVCCCLLLVGAGVMVGRMLQSPGFLAVTDPRSGARLVAVLSPSDSGTGLSVTVSGLPVGTACQLTVVGVDGSRITDGSGWRVPVDAASRPVSTHVWMSSSSISTLSVTTSARVVLVVHVSA